MQIIERNILLRWQFKGKKSSFSFFLEEINKILWKNVSKWEKTKSPELFSIKSRKLKNYTRGKTALPVADSTQFKEVRMQHKTSVLFILNYLLGL